MTSRKVTTTIRINDNIRDKLRKQAYEVGMDVSNYVAYLVLFREELFNKRKDDNNGTKF